MLKKKQVTNEQKLEVTETLYASAVKLFTDAEAKIDLANEELEKTQQEIEQQILKLQNDSVATTEQLNRNTKFKEKIREFTT